MHPLTSSLTDLNDEDLLKKLNELHSRLRTSLGLRNPAYVQQLTMILDDYQSEYNKRMAQQAEKFAQANKKLTDKIDIE
jgi:hypothetical protein